MPFAAGVRPDGSKKLRPVDDMSKSLVNAATQPAEKNVNNRLDELLEAARRLFKASNKVSADCLLVFASFARLQKPMRRLSFQTSSSVARSSLRAVLVQS